MEWKYSFTLSSVVKKSTNVVVLLIHESIINMTTKLLHELRYRSGVRNHGVLPRVLNLT